MDISQSYIDLGNEVWHLQDPDSKMVHLDLLRIVLKSYTNTASTKTSILSAKTIKTACGYLAIAFNENKLFSPDDALLIIFLIALRRTNPKAPISKVKELFQAFKAQPKNTNKEHVAAVIPSQPLTVPLYARMFKVLAKSPYKIFFEHLPVAKVKKQLENRGIDFDELVFQGKIEIYDRYGVDFCFPVCSPII